jgi:hypothetical protein
LISDRVNGFFFESLALKIKTNLEGEKNYFRTTFVIPIPTGTVKASREKRDNKNKNGISKNLEKSQIK